MSTFGAAKARQVLAIKRERGTSHRTLARAGWRDYVFSFHDQEELGPKMLSRSTLASEEPLLQAPQTLEEGAQVPRHARLP